MNLENRINFMKDLMKQIPNENMEKAFEYQEKIYNSLPSCKFAEDYNVCMRKKLTIVKEKTLKKYGGLKTK